VTESPREGGPSAAFLGVHKSILNMIPLQPVSVKFTDEERARLRALASALGWTESKVLRDSVAAVIHLVGHPEDETPPKIIGLARHAIQLEKDSPLASLAKDQRPP
jgi:hypothetical protein